MLITLSSNNQLFTHDCTISYLPHIYHSHGDAASVKGRMTQYVSSQQ